jgi:hypothetical protein
MRVALFVDYDSGVGQWMEEFFMDSLVTVELSIYFDEN